MKNRRIEISLGKTINLGNFESIKIQVGLSEDISERDILEDSLNNLFEDMTVKLSEYCEELEKLHSNKNKRLKVNRNG